MTDSIGIPKRSLNGSWAVVGSTRLFGEGCDVDVMAKFEQLDHVVSYFDVEELEPWRPAHWDGCLVTPRPTEAGFFLKAVGYTPTGVQVEIKVMPARIFEPIAASYDRAEVIVGRAIDPMTRLFERSKRQFYRRVGVSTTASIMDPFHTHPTLKLRSSIPVPPPRQAAVFVTPSPKAITPPVPIRLVELSKPRIERLIQVTPTTGLDSDLRWNGSYRSTWRDDQ